jgi:hypothetical protein
VIVSASRGHNCKSRAIARLFFESFQTAAAYTADLKSWFTHGERITNISNQKRHWNHMLPASSLSSSQRAGRFTLWKTAD